MNYTTPQVAALAQTTIRTIRHWESVGMLGKVARDRRGDRVFTETQLRRAKMVSAASMAGMALDEIRVAHAWTLLSKISEACAFMGSVCDELKEYDL